MAKVNKESACDMSEKKCGCGDKCECGCGCGCSCCKKKFLKIFVLLIVFLAGIGCGCLICCCGGCKGFSHHRRPIPMMARHGFNHPKNNVIVIRTDGDEVVPEVAKVGDDFRNYQEEVLIEAEVPAEEAPVAEEVQPEAPAETASEEAPAAE